jgi:molybdopterin/thiamine biosynthesis adenylyltransferase
MAKSVSADIRLTKEEMQRYGRHFVLPAVGVDGQKKLKSSSVLIVGAGGLGSVAAMYLAGAGVGRLGIADYDNVDLSNLHRQLLYTSADIGKPKVLIAEKKIL